MVWRYGAEDGAMVISTGPIDKVLKTDTKCEYPLCQIMIRKWICVGALAIEFLLGKSRRAIALLRLAILLAEVSIRLSGLPHYVFSEGSPFWCCSRLQG